MFLTDLERQIKSEALELIATPTSGKVLRLARVLRTYFNFKEDEFSFHPRGIGNNWIRCFECGGMPEGSTIKDKVKYDGPCQKDMACFVRSDQAEVVMKLLTEDFRFDYGVELDSRNGRVQIKLGACEKHEPELEALMNECSDGLISTSRIQRAIWINRDDKDWIRG